MADVASGWPLSEAHMDFAYSFSSFPRSPSWEMPAQKLRASSQPMRTRKEQGIRGPGRHEGGRCVSTTHAKAWGSRLYFATSKVCDCEPACGPPTSSKLISSSETQLGNSLIPWGQTNFSSP